MVDYLEVVPDTAWTDHGPGHAPQYVDDREALRFFTAFREQKPIVAHSIGLSIGSAHRFREEHIEQVRRWDGLLDFPWHSDHLAFNIVEDEDGEEALLGVPFSVTHDEDMLAMLAARVLRIRSAIDKPFLLENNVSYIRYADEGFDPPIFLNELCRRAGCGVLLDLHNLYVDWRNGAVDAEAFLASLDLSRVVEVHLAGGLTYEGTYLDAHCGGVPDDLWPIVTRVLPECPNLRGVTFELLGSWYARFGERALVDTLARIRDLERASRHRRLRA
ncbi:DUF692 domain-containing protein [Reyranella sp.]|uniref:DUF692 domain-containing protein n=1 Tax=Reyranella sp. TaxID=1929291 RepID=UPI003D10D38F